MKKNFMILLFVLAFVLNLPAQSVPQKMIEPVPAQPVLQNVSSQCNAPYQGIGTEVTSGPINNSVWVANCLNLDVDMQILKRDIVAYKIKYFNGSWSTWYFPGVNDLYIKPGEPWRRVWACFSDHTFMYIYNQY